MRTRPTILLHIDDRRRDALACLLLGKMLEAMGNRVYFCNRFTNRLAWAIVQPDAMVMPYVWTCINSPEELATRARRTKFIIMPTEGLAVPEEQARDVMAVYDPSIKIDRAMRTQYSRHIEKLLHWGHTQRTGLIEREVAREDQVAVVGSIRYDLFRPEFGIAVHAAGSAGLGFVGQFDSVNVFDQRSVFQTVDGLRQAAVRGRYYDEERELEDYMWSYYAYLRIYMTLIEKGIRERNGTILYRAHPFEHLASYAYLQRKFGRRFILDRPANPLPLWLHSLAAVVFTVSSVGFEAMLMGKPAISVQGIIETRLREHLTTPRFWYPYANWCWRPKSVDEALDLMELAFKRELASNHLSNPEFQRYAKEQADWPRPEPSIFSAAKEIDLIAKRGCAEQPPSSVAASLRVLKAKAGLLALHGYRCCQATAMELRGIWYHTPSLKGRIQEQRYSAFYPWHRYEFRLADRLYPTLTRLSGLDGGRRVFPHGHDTVS